jgi:hypothetical protein
MPIILATKEAEIRFEVCLGSLRDPTLRKNHHKKRTGGALKNKRM